MRSRRFECLNGAPADFTRLDQSGKVEVYYLNDNLPLQLWIRGRLASIAIKGVLGGIGLMGISGFVFFLRRRVLSTEAAKHEGGPTGQQPEQSDGDL
jgi:hypothetical protein